MGVVVTLQYIMGQLITFCVPLIIIGFIAPSITKLGKNASRLLAVAIVIAYVSSVCAAFMSMGAGYGLIPHLSIDNNVAGLRELPGVVFELNIPQIMSVMSALVLSVLVGLAATWTNSKLTCDFLAEFQNIVLDIVSKVIIPVPALLHCRHLLRPELRGHHHPSGCPPSCRSSSSLWPVTTSGWLCCTCWPVLTPARILGKWCVTTAPLT